MVIYCRCLPHISRIFDEIGMFPVVVVLGDPHQPDLTQFSDPGRAAFTAEHLVVVLEIVVVVPIERVLFETLSFALVKRDVVKRPITAALTCRSCQASYSVRVNSWLRRSFVSGGPLRPSIELIRSSRGNSNLWCF